MLSANSDSVKSFHESFYGTPTMDEPRRRRGKKRHPVAKEEPHNEVAVVGTHYRSFDDDVMAAFVNSATALVPWNGDPKLLIDRYDVRHLLLDLTGIRRRRARAPSPDATKEELDNERYRDVEGLENPSPAEDDQATDGNDAGGYLRVGFNYGSELTASKERVDEVLFTPPFFVPEHLRASVPTSTKLHQIMAGTAKYVIEHGGQAEIVLRVKQANNPTFGFLMPDHPDHEYFRFLVAHPEHVGIAPEPQPVDVVAPPEKVETSSEDMEGGLSLLGTAYGASDDDDGEEEGGAPSLDLAQDQQGDVAHRDDDPVRGDDDVKESDEQQDTKNLPDDKQEAETEPMEAEAQPGETDAHKVEEPAPPGVSEPVPPGADNTDASGASDIVSELPFKEPPVQVGLIIDKMVEFISRNGKEFEGIVRERDKANQRFPFFLPWNEYHPYYSQKLKAAREAQTAGGENAVSDATLVGEFSGTKDDQVLRKEVEDSFLIGVPFWDESLAVEAGDGVSAASVDTATPQPDEADHARNGDGGMGFDAVLAAVRAATRGRPLGGEGLEGADLPKASEIEERPEIGSDEAVLAAIRTATGRAKLESSVSGGRGANVPGESLDDLAESVPAHSAVESTSPGAPSLEVLVPLAGHASQENNAEAKAASPTADGSGALPEVELTPTAKRRAERLKKAKAFAAMIKEKDGSHSSSRQPSGVPEFTERLNLAVATVGNSNSGNSPDRNLAAFTEVEAEKRDLVGTGQPEDVQLQVAIEADEGLAGIERENRGSMEERDEQQGGKNVNHLPTRKDRDRQNDREHSTEREETRNHNHYQESRKKERKHRRHYHDTHEQDVDNERHDREQKPKERAGAEDLDDGEDYREDRSHRDREHKRKRKDSKHSHGDKKSSRRNGHEASESRREKTHEQDTDKVRKESRYRGDSEEDDWRDDRYGHGHLQAVGSERREARHRYAESQIIRDSSRYRRDSGERDKERERERYEDDVEERRKDRSRRHGKRRKHTEDSSDEAGERYSRRHEGRTKRSRRRDDDADGRATGPELEEKNDTVVGHGWERSDLAGTKSEEKPPSSEKPALTSADVPDDIRAKVRAMLHAMK